MCHLPQTAQCQRLRDMLEKHGSRQRMLKVRGRDACGLWSVVETVPRVIRRSGCSAGRHGLKKGIDKLEIRS